MRSIDYIHIVFGLLLPLWAWLSSYLQECHQSFLFKHLSVFKETISIIVINYLLIKFLFFFYTHTPLFLFFYHF